MDKVLVLRLGNKRNGQKRLLGIMERITLKCHFKQLTFEDERVGEYFGQTSQCDFLVLTHFQHLLKAECSAQCVFFWYFEHIYLGS